MPLNRDDVLNIISDISECTELNDHTGALILLAEFLNETRKLRLLEAIRADQLMRGEITMENYNARMDVGDLLLLSAKSYFRMNDEINLYTKLKGAL